MRWEKTGDWASITRPKTYLSIPCENLYRLWETYQYQKRHRIPSVRASIELFLLEAFARLHELDQRERVERELYRTAVQVTLAQAQGGKITSEVIDRVLALFHTWHVTVEPSAVRPTAMAADQLLAQMDAYKALFENSAGFRVSAADVPFRTKGQ